MSDAPLEPGGHEFTGLFIAIPCGSGSIRNETAISLLKTVLLLEAKGLHCEVKIEPHIPIAMYARNKLAASFMYSNCSHVLMVDADLRWYPQDVLRMLEHDKNWVCGAAHASSDEDEYAVVLPADVEGPYLSVFGWAEPRPPTVCSHCGCIDLELGNVSFALLHRSIFERMFEAYPELKLKGNLYALFDTIVEDGKLWGEDYAFCKRWRAIGGRAWLDPTIVLTHYGVKGWTGNVQKWLAREGR